MSTVTFLFRLASITMLAALVWEASAKPAAAQSTGYSVGEAGAEAKQPSTPVDSSPAGPVRLARFSYIQGGVTWRADETADWSTATINQPFRQGAEISVAAGGRAEIQFDDGGYLRLGSASTAILKLLFSDAEGEFTEIALTSGLGSLRLKHDRSVYQIDTPIVSVKADGPAQIRIGISDGVEVGVRQGVAVVEGAKGKVNMSGGDYLDLRDATSAFALRDLPPADSWENWNEDRDQMLDGATQSLVRHDVPADVALVAGNLDAYGTWRSDVAYGQVWCPRTIDASWRPYFAGHWAWVNPFGWTWCSDEPWGWAPYHYGTWFHAIYGWAWRPGPANQYWSPAVVHFSEYNGSVAWCALAPNEVEYPAAILVGTYGARWPGYFSIGAAGCYYPNGSGYAVGTSFSASLSIRSATVVQANGKTAVTGGAISAARPFVPVNAKAAAGATVSTQAAFAGHGAFTPLIAGSTIAFTLGHTAPTPPSGKAPLSGPAGVRPPAGVLVSTGVTGRDSSNAGSALGRQVFASAVPKEPVHTGVAAPLPLNTSGTIRSGVGGSSSNTSSGVVGRSSGSASDAAAAARSGLNGGRSPVGSASSSGGATTNGAAGGNPNTSSGYTAGRSSGGSSAGSPVGGSPAPSSGSAGHGSSGGPSPGGSSQGGGSSAGHTSGGSTGGGSGGYHVGGGAPAGGAPVRR